MIKKINKLKGFGIFRDFSWDGLEEFKKFNLIYGWNYSGKTTLSRVFQCFELRRLHNDYQPATFEFELKDGRKYDQSQLEESFAVRVFNSDFIKDNLKWEEGIEPVFLVGEENIKLEQQLKEFKAELKKKLQRIGELWGTVQIKNEKIETGLTDKARVIRNTLLLPYYEKPQFHADVQTLPPNAAINQLSDDEFSSYLTKYNSTEKQDTIPEISLSIPNMPNLCSQTKVLLQKTATANIIERLKENSVLENWVKDGVGLHEGKSVCEFCGRELTKDRLDILNGHFSEEYNFLMTEIDQLITKLESNIINLEFPAKAEFYADLRKEYEQSKIRLESESKSFNDSLNELINNLNTKKTKPFEAIAITKPQDNTKQLNAEIDKVNGIIQKHGDRTDRFEETKKEAKDKLIKHWASEFAIEINYSETLKEIKRIENSISEINKENIETRGEINKIEQKLSDAVKGAGRINEYLHSYFGTDEIEMTVAEDDKYFKLERSGHQADNLCEGEKTAIAFSHFMATLEDRGATLADTIIFIDDPVSSLDCNHLYHTYSFINSRLADCKQLFISTHNFEFFNLVKEWFRGKNSKVRSRNKDKEESEQKVIPCGFYMVENFTEDGKRKAHIKELEKTLKKFKSEYHFLFYQLHKFKESESSEYKDLYTIGNIARRFFEIFTNFKIPTTGDFASKIKALKINIDKINEIQQGKVYKLIQESSHGSDPTSTIEHKDKNETRETIKIKLDMIQEYDGRHFELLRRESL